MLNYTTLDQKLFSQILDIPLGNKTGSAASIAAPSPSPCMRSISGETSSTSTIKPSENQSYTEACLRELYEQVNSMPESAKKKKLIRQFEKQSDSGSSAESRTPFTRRHWRSRSVGAIIKKKALVGQIPTEKENRTLESLLSRS